MLAPPLLAVLLMLLLSPLADADGKKKATDDKKKGFSIQNVSVGSGTEAVRVSVLRNHDTGESVDILQSFGGKVERVSLLVGSCDGGQSCDPRDVIASRCNGTYVNCTSALLKAQDAPGALLMPFANRIAHGRYSFQGAEHRLTSDNSTPSHGFLIQGRPMDVLAHSTSKSNATLVLGALFDGTDPGYPFTVHVTVSYTLSAAGLSVHIKATNCMASSAAPFQAGCHPYFRLLNSNFSTAHLTLDRSCTQWNRQMQTPIQVPSHTTESFDGFDNQTIASPHIGCPACGHPAPHWDDGFTPRSSVQACPELAVRLADGPDTLTLTLGDGFRYVQVYSGSPQTGVAIEPYTGETDCFNNEEGLVVLEAGQDWEGSFRIGIE